jgi:hypothetical protein
MRNVTRKVMWACCAGFAAGAALVGGAGVASAATGAPGLQPQRGVLPVHSPVGLAPQPQRGRFPGHSPAGPGLQPQRGGFPGHSPAGKAGCNPWQLERWNLNGANEVVAVYGGRNFDYSVTFKQIGSCLGGTLNDSNYPFSGPISGTVKGDLVTFSFSYPSGAVQVTRTYTGTIGRWGDVKGTWTQTGSQAADNLPWSLQNKAAPACAKYWLRIPQACPVVW